MSIKIYLAGGFFDGEIDWRFDVASGLDNAKVESRSSRARFSDIRNAVFNCIDYVGPFPGWGSEISPIKQAIKDADIVFAWIGNIQNASELSKVSAEISYADAFGKLVGVGTTSASEENYNYIWTAIDMASFFPFAFIAPTPKEALLKCLQDLIPFIGLDKQIDLFKTNNHARRFLQSRLDRSGYIYLIKAETGQYKIGRSVNIPDRMRLFAVKLPFKFDIIRIFPADDATKAEGRLHAYFGSKRANGEWFNLSPTDEELLREVICFQDEQFFGSDKIYVYELDWPTQEEVRDFDEYFAELVGH